MAKKKHQIDTTLENKNKLDLKTTLESIDRKRYKFYDGLTDQEKKGYTPFVLMRFISSAPDQKGMHSYFLQSVNDIINVDFWTLNKHHELCHKLFCLIGLGNTMFHRWIPGPKGPANNKLFECLKSWYPNANSLEIKVLMKNMTEAKLKKMCEDLGWEDDDVKKCVKEYAQNK